MGDMEELKKRLEKEQREIRIRKFTKNKASVFGLVVVTVMILLAVLAPLICRYDPLALDVKSRLQGCSATTGLEPTPWEEMCLPVYYMERGFLLRLVLP